MNTKEAIEFIENELKTYKDILESFGIPEMKKEKEDIKNAIANYKNVIELLQRGEKFEAMWNHLYCEYGEVFLNDYKNPEILLEERMENLEQKYFPKPSDNFTEKVMEKINKKGEV